MPSLTEFTPLTGQDPQVQDVRSITPPGYSIATSLACFVEFRQARDQLLVQFEPAVPRTGSASEALQREARLSGWARSLETPLSWLISAAALAWVLLAVLRL